MMLSLNMEGGAAVQGMQGASKGKGQGDRPSLEPAEGMQLCRLILDF